jgi:hypothetical protein
LERSQMFISSVLKLTGRRKRIAILALLSFIALC